MGKGVKCILAGALLISVLLFPAKREMEVDVLDVGQGDGCFIRTAGGAAIFVDGGSSSVRGVGQYRILPFLKCKGEGEVDLWIVSHTDEDHISGLREALEAGYRVRCLAFSAAMERDEAYCRLEELAKAQGTRIVFLKRGDKVGIGGAALEVLSPAEGVAYADKNAASLTVRYEDGGFSGIFTGDIGAEQEAEMLGAGVVGGAGAVDFYKAAHHGSRYSNTREFLLALSPLASVISCGEGNRYGHPSEEAVRNMEESGSAVFCTMEAGQVSLQKEGGRLRVRRFFDGE